MLALSPSFFRGDMQCFAKSNEVRVLLIDERWLTRLMYQFYPLDASHLSRRLFVNPRSDELTWDGKQRYRQFLRNFLPYFNRILGIDCVLGYHFLHRSHVDWGAISDELGVPYVAMHSESMYLSMPYIYEAVCCRVSKMGKFEGSHIVVYCKTGADAFSSTGFVQPEDISYLGAPRMDPFVRKVRNLTPTSRSRKQVTFFVFLLDSAPGEALHSFFRDAHLAIAHLAIENPNIGFILKSKRNYWRTWSRLAQEVWQEADLEWRDIPNLKMGYDADPHDLILESDVVCAFNSTTLLEAGVAAKPVVVPYFGAARSADYDDRVLWREQLTQAFDVAATPESFKELILGRLDDPIVGETAMALRRQMFEEFVSDLKGGATERYVDLLKRIVGSRKSEMSLDHGINRPPPCARAEG